MTGNEINRRSLREEKIVARGDWTLPFLFIFNSFMTFLNWAPHGTIFGSTI